jgi:hypothetical protein
VDRIDATGVLAIGLGTVAGSVATTRGWTAVVVSAVCAVCVGLAVVLVPRVTTTRAPDDPNR